MIAQAGATFRHLAAHPRNRPAAPSSCQIEYRNRGIERSSGLSAVFSSLDVVVSEPPSVFGRMLRDLLPRLADVERRGDNTSRPPRNRPREKTIHKSRSMVVSASTLRSRPCQRMGRLSQVRQFVSHGFVSPPVDPTKRNVPPHRQGQPSPERSVPLRPHHLPQTHECLREDAGSARRRGLHARPEHLDRTHRDRGRDARDGACDQGRVGVRYVFVDRAAMV